MSLLRNRRGRIRCFYQDCDHWASVFEITATDWSVAAHVPMCVCCAWRGPISQFPESCEGQAAVA